MKFLINFLKTIASMLGSGIIYLIGLLSYGVFLDQQSTSIWYWITLFITVALIGVPALSYWEHRIDSLLNKKK